MPGSKGGRASVDRPNGGYGVLYGRKPFINCSSTFTTQKKVLKRFRRTNQPNLSGGDRAGKESAKGKLNLRKPEGCLVATGGRAYLQEGKEERLGGVTILN